MILSTRSLFLGGTYAPLRSVSAPPTVRSIKVDLKPERDRRVSARLSRICAHANAHTFMEYYRVQQ